MSGILIILIAILFCAFFSGMEIAFISSNKLRLELDIKQGDFSSGILKIIAKNPGQYIATMLVGNNVALVLYGIFFSRLLNPVLAPLFGSDLLALIVNTLISTAVILFVAEFLPKTTFILAPNSFLNTLCLPTLIFFWLFYPVSKSALLASNLLIRIFSRNKPVSRSHENIVFSKVDLDHFVSQSREREESAAPQHHNIKIFQNALDFSSVKLRECMVPRTEIEAVECNSSITELKEKFIETQHSRILVFQESIDNIIGYFDLKDIFRNPPDIKSSIRKLAIVPETMAANKLLKVFVDEKKNVALVVDEFGGTSGIVTIEDVLEEIVGDIEDEHDIQELTEKVISRNEYIFSGRLEIDYLNEKYHLHLPEEDDYETLAGMILFFHGSIPGNNDVIRIRNIVFRILKVTSTRVELVNIKVE
jgi:CBS domain containing-hemolysin-like protein